MSGVKISDTDFSGNHAAICTSSKPESNLSKNSPISWKRREPSSHAVRDAELASEISRVWEESRRTYGSPRVFMQLRRDGVSTSEKRVARIMRERGWVGVSRRCAKSPDGREKRVSRKDGAPDLVKRKFEADGPDQAWFADITYVRTYRGWLYLAIVMDIWSRRIVGWSMGDRIDARLADDALRMAIARRRPPGGCLHHSDYAAENAKPQFSLLSLADASRAVPHAA